MTICHLDADDEITGAIARIRSVRDGQAVLVLPAGSRIGTSRINFRLLAREATERGLDAVIVSDEPAVRALAISAGLPAYDSVAGAETALLEFHAQPGQTARGRAAAGGADAAQRTRIMPPAAGTSELETTRLPGAEAVPPAGEGPPPDVGEPLGSERRPVRRRRLGAAPLLVGTLLLLLLAGTAYAAYLLLPTATISLRPHLERLGPLEMTVIADPAVAVPNAAEGVIPAQRLDIPLRLSDTFPASGSQVTQSRATGMVRFFSENTVFEVTIPADTPVTTESGIEFRTTRSVTLGRASFAAGRRATADAPVRAARPGPRSNVAARTITRLPREFSEALITVLNRRPTTGGRREEVTVVTPEDYDAALSALTAALPAELARRLADPATTPRGLTVFPGSARIGPSTPETPPGELAGTVTERFELAVGSVATVVAVNEGLVDQLVQERVTSSVPAGATLVGGSVSIQRTDGVVVADTVVYRATASGETYRLPDRDALLSQIRGRSVADAQAIMERHGTVELSVWPEFIERVPEQLSRINLTVLPPEEGP